MGELIVIKKQIVGMGGVRISHILNNDIPLQCAGDNSTNHNKCVSRLTKSADLHKHNNTNEFVHSGC